MADRKRGIVPLCLAAVFCLFFNATCGDVAAAEPPELTEQGARLLRICRGAVSLSREYSDSIWPGFTMADYPFLSYVPGEWAMLVNYPHQPDGFLPFPADWPDIGTPAWLYPGEYNNLAGQLSFYVAVDSIHVAAVPLLEKPDDEMLAFLIHETFHQYQYDTFGEIPWAREEKYPLQDTENSALACLEMRILMEAVSAADAGNDELCRELAQQFVAVRDYRWRHADQFVAQYEQGQEIREGTAKYIEVKSMALFLSGAFLMAGQKDEISDPQPLSMPQRVLADFDKRLTGNALAPQDVPRNRIYPVGSALGFLLDYFGVDWKTPAQLAGSEFTFAGLLRDYLNMAAEDIAELLIRAKATHNYDRIALETDSLIQQYLADYQSELAAFETQPGFRIEIELSSNGVRRSRSSDSQRWLVDQGTVTFCSHFNIYSLTKEDLVLQVRDVGLLEHNDWDRKIRNVAFYLPIPPTIVIDSTKINHIPGHEVRFRNIDLHNALFKFVYNQPGMAKFTDNGVKVNIVP